MIQLFQDMIDQKKMRLEPELDEEQRRLNRMLKQEVQDKFAGKLRLYIVDSGSCGACELELQTLFNPMYNVSKAGIEVVYNPKEADIMLMTGLLTENIYQECERVYGELKEPKRFITVGDCPVMLAPFKETFAIKGEANIHFSVGQHISGCPPTPRVLLKGLLKYLQGI